MRYIYVLLLSLLLCRSYNQAIAQELLAEVRISTDALGNVDKTQYSELEQQIRDLLNNTRWTNQIYTQGERISCLFTINLSALEEDYRYKGELSISANRPVFGTNYTTTTFIHRDKDLSFEYQAGDRLELSTDGINSHLVALVAYYAHVIIALDLDSFGPLSGSDIRDGIMQISSQASTHPEWTGWDAFGSNTRVAWTNALSEGGQETFRQIWYQYHRHGLDILEQNIDQGRRTLLAQTQALEEFQRSYSRSPFISLFETTKVEELVQIFAQAPNEQKHQMLDIMRRLFPTRSTSWERLAQN